MSPGKDYQEKLRKASNRMKIEKKKKQKQKKKPKKPDTVLNSIISSSKC
jgi:hypothetical protein